MSEIAPISWTKAKSNRQILVQCKLGSPRYRKKCKAERNCALDKHFASDHPVRLSLAFMKRGRAMPFDRIARLVALAPMPDFRADDLRVRFHNLLQSLEWGQITATQANKRLQAIDSFFFRNPIHAVPAHAVSVLMASCQAADDHIKEADHYQRTEPLNYDLATRAVTFQRNQFGRLGENLLGVRATGDEIKAAFDARRSAFAKPFVNPLGAPDRPIWLTPYSGKVAEYCEELQLDTIGPARRASVVRALVAKLGLIHFSVDDEVLAFVTALPIGQLTFGHPASKTPAAAADRLPVGPTPFEARDHRRFRNWAAPPVDSFGYGRTYELEAAERASVGGAEHGAAEAVRPRMSMDAFTECIVLGTLKERAEGDSDLVYYREIGVDMDLPGILHALHRRLRI